MLPVVSRLLVFHESPLPRSVPVMVSNEPAKPPQLLKIVMVSPKAAV